MKDVMLILHFLGIAMGAGVSFAFLFLGLTARKMAKEEAQKFMLNSYNLTRMGNIGLVLLFLSGGYLMTPYWKLLGEMPLLATKLVLFLALGAFLGMISSNARKARQGDSEKYMKKIETFGKLALLVTITIVVLAVLSFH